MIRTDLFYKKIIFKKKINIKKMADNLEEIAKQIFDVYDHDKSGYIEIQELSVMLVDTYKKMGIEKSISNEEVAATLSFIDLNADGKISLQEYIELMKKSFAMKQ